MIKRDGTQKSLWQDILPYQPLREVNGDRFDVIIVGAGMTGITTGLLLQRAGKNCLLIEAQNIGFGTSGGTTAHLNTLLDTPYSKIISGFGLETAIEVKNATEDAIDLIQQHVEEFSIDCEFQRVPAYLLARDGDQLTELEKIYDACQQVGLQTSYADHTSIDIPFLKSMKVEQQAKFHPLIYLHRLAEEFEKAGGSFLDNCTLQDTDQKKEGVEVSTTRGIFHADKLVYATHIPPGINLLHLRCAPWRSYAIAVQLADENYPDELYYDLYDPYHYYRTQWVSQKPYLIAGGEDHKTGKESNTESSFLRLISHVRNYFQVSKISYQWSSQYFESVDGLPYIGKLPGSKDEQIYVATGYGGNGMVYSTIAARIISSMIAGSDELSYQHTFNPTRIKPIAGFKEFIKHNTDVAKEFLHKWIPAEKLNSVVDLSPGEGQIVKFEGEEIALAKDLDGRLHAVSPKCVHMKCIVQWNLAEQTWDCPCHGARYQPDGKMITGPATSDLTPIELRALIERK